MQVVVDNLRPLYNYVTCAWVNRLVSVFVSWHAGPNANRVRICGHRFQRPDFTEFAFPFVFHFRAAATIQHSHSAAFSEDSQRVQWYLFNTHA